MTPPSRSERARASKIMRARACAVAFSLMSGLYGSEAWAWNARPSADPLEGVNRAFFAFNQFLDHVLIRPAAMAYQHILPDPLRRGLRNAASNLGEPSVAVNDILQGRGARGLKSAARFTINSTLGVFGLFDFARRAGLAGHANDFGITLARIGVSPGPYLVIPVAGPNTVRDAIGNLADIALNPLAYARYAGDKAVGITSVVSSGLDTRAEADQSLKALAASATDPYASLRSFWLQNREAQITGGKINLDSLPDFGADPSQPPLAAPPHPAPPEPQTAQPRNSSDLAPAPPDALAPAPVQGETGSPPGEAIAAEPGPVDAP